MLGGRGAPGHLGDQQFHASVPPLSSRGGSNQSESCMPCTAPCLFGRVLGIKFGNSSWGAHDCPQPGSSSGQTDHGEAGLSPRWAPSRCRVSWARGKLPARQVHHGLHQSVEAEGTRGPQKIQLEIRWAWEPEKLPGE